MPTVWHERWWHFFFGQRTLLRTLSDHTRFQCSKRMGPSGATWTINHNMPPIKCIPKRQCNPRRRRAYYADRPSHPVDNHAAQSDVIVSRYVDRSPSVMVDVKHDEASSFFPIGPASGPHGKYIQLPPLPTQREVWCPTSPRLWCRSEMPPEFSS